jgi:hypothetical protein
MTSDLRQNQSLLFLFFQGVSNEAAVSQFPVAFNDS